MQTFRNGLVILALVTCMSSVAEAHWFENWHLKFCRWTGYGFGDGYHRCPCQGQVCDHDDHQADCTTGGCAQRSLHDDIWTASSLPTGSLNRSRTFSQNSIHAKRHHGGQARTTAIGPATER